jgi:opacity protein-like surface antigen
MNYTERTNDLIPRPNGDHPLKRTVLILAMLTACSSLALGQAAPDATRAGDLQAGATYTFAYPDYTPQKAMGFGAYVAFDFKTHWGAEVSFHEVDIDQHSPAKEVTFDYGARYHRTYGRYNPYLKGFAGRGTFDFAPDFQQLGASPSYNLLGFGAGVDTQLTTRLNLRVGMEYQSWFTGGASGKQVIDGNPTSGVLLPHGLTPVLYEVGFAYHFTGGSIQ